MRLSIIIPVFNNWMFTQNVMNKFESLSNNYEIIIIDNGSYDGTDKNIVPFLKNNVRYIRNNSNCGFGRACNQGYAISVGRSVMFLNNDIKFGNSSFEWLDQLCDHVESLSPALVGPTGGLVDSKTFQFKYETENPKDKINYMSGWCLTAKRSTWDSLILPGNDGPFDAKSFFCYFEDTDLGFRSLMKKIKFDLHPVPLVHIGKQTSKNMNVSQLYLQSREVFVKKWKNQILKKI